MNYKVGKLQDFISPGNKELFEKVINHKRVSKCLELGGWIAGGLALALFTGEELSEYLRTGDIDIFFPSEELALQACEESDMSSLFAKNHPVSFGPFSFTTIQFITHKDFCAPGGIQECLDRFDLVNCKVGFDRENIYYHPELAQLEQDGILKIGHAESPFLISRIIKYFSKHKYNSLHPDSNSLINDWLIKASHKNFTIFGKKYNVDKLNKYEEMKNQAISKVQALTKYHKISREHLALFVGQYQEYIYHQGEDYCGSYEALDWALNEIKKKGEQNV